MIDEEAVIEAAGALTDLIGKTVPKHQVARDKAIRGATRKIQKLARSRFRAQRKAVLDSHALRTLPVAEADTQERTARETEIATALGPLIYHQPVTAAQQETFAHAVEVAIENGSQAVAEMLTTAVPETESFIAEYLKDGGFARLTGDLDKTTVDNLASAVADAYEAGADFDGVVQAVKDSFAEASDVRAKMIAQTELNNAWNQSIFHFGNEAGALGKSWETEPGACIICIANEMEGIIPMDQDFESGDDAPTAHPLCYCSLLVHAGSGN